MVARLIEWFARLLTRHGYRVIKEDDYIVLGNIISESHYNKQQITTLQEQYALACKEIDASKRLSDDLFRCLCKLDTRITALEKWCEEQPEPVKNSDNLSQIVYEWLNGEETQ